MVKQIFVNKILSDKEVSNLEGTWITEDHIKLPIINEDSDNLNEQIDIGEDVTVEDVTVEVSTNLDLEDNGGEIVSDILLGENEVINSVVNNITNNVIENNHNSKMDKSEILIFYMNKSVNELRDILKEKDLPTSGNKSKLISRIINN